MDATEYARRRDALMSRMGDDAIAVIAGAGECPRNRDVDYPFRQSSDFRYLTGFIEPDAVAVLAPGGPRARSSCSRANATRCARPGRAAPSARPPRSPNTAPMPPTPSRNSTR